MADETETVEVPAKLASDMIWLLDHYGVLLNQYDGGGRRPINLPAHLGKLRKAPVPDTVATDELQPKIDAGCQAMVQMMLKTNSSAFTQMAFTGGGVPRGLVFGLLGDPIQLSRCINGIKTVIEATILKDKAGG